MTVSDAELYALLHQGNVGDVDWYCGQCEGAGSVLELGAGYGRIALRLAEVGLEVHGVEQDGGLLELAQARASGLPDSIRSRLSWTHGDLGSLALGRRFDRVVLPYNAFYCLTDAGQVRAALEVVSRHLAPEGLFLFDVWAAEDFHAGVQAGDIQASAEFEPLTTLHTPEGPADVLERCQFGADTRKLAVSYRVALASGARVVEVPQRYWLWTEIDDLLAEAELDHQQVLERFPGESEEEERWVVSARRG